MIENGHFVGVVIDKGLLNWQKTLLRQTGKNTN